MVDIAPDIPGTVLLLRATGPGTLAIARRLLAIARRQMAIVLDIRGTVGLRQPLFPLPALGIRTGLVRILRGRGRAAEIRRHNR